MVEFEPYLEVTYEDRTVTFDEGDFYAGCPQFIILQSFDLPLDTLFTLVKKDDGTTWPQGLYNDDTNTVVQGRYVLIVDNMGVCE